MRKAFFPRFVSVLVCLLNHHGFNLFRFHFFVKSFFKFFNKKFKGFLLNEINGLQSMKKIKGKSFLIFFRAFQPPAIKKRPPPAVDSRAKNRYLIKEGRRPGICASRTPPLGLRRGFEGRPGYLSFIGERPATGILRRFRFPAWDQRVFSRPSACRAVLGRSRGQPTPPQ